MAKASSSEFLSEPEYDDDDDDKQSVSMQSGSEPSEQHSQKSAKKKRNKYLNVVDYGPPLPSSGDDSDIGAAEGAYSRLSKQERREFRMAFRLFDKDDDGTISVPELKVVFEGLNYHFSESQLVDMLKSIDDNGDGKVDINEFVYVMKGSNYNDPSNRRTYLEELQEAFEVFDKDGDEHITPQELAAIMKALGEDLTGPDILHMIQEADADGDGNIDFPEFKKLMEEDHFLYKYDGPTSIGSQHTMLEEDDDEHKLNEYADHQFD